LPMPIENTGAAPFCHSSTGMDEGGPSVMPDYSRPGSLSHACSLMDLTSHSCRWPLWTDAKPERLYCGAPTDGVYCGHHTRVAWRKRS
jgi:hypothetical protein